MILEDDKKSVYFIYIVNLIISYCLGWFFSIKATSFNDKVILSIIIMITLICLYFSNKMYLKYLKKIIK